MTLAKPAAFFDAIRAARLFGPTLDASEVSGLNAILAACEGSPLAYAAYMLATPYLETAHTMQPIKEFGGDAYFFRRYDPHGNRPDIAARLGNTQPGDGARYPGMGFVQSTGRRNAQRADDELQMNGEIIRNPSLLMRPDIAAKVLRLGMTEGWFTGRRLADHLPPHGPARLEDFKASRPIINGHDREDEIAMAAMAFQDALVAGGWA